MICKLLSILEALKLKTILNMETWLHQLVLHLLFFFYACKYCNQGVYIRYPIQANFSTQVAFLANQKSFYLLFNIHSTQMTAFLSHTLPLICKYFMERLSQSCKSLVWQSVSVNQLSFYKHQAQLMWNVSSTLAGKSWRLFENFVYLGSLINCQCFLYDEVSLRRKKKQKTLAPFLFFKTARDVRKT